MNGYEIDVLSPRKANKKKMDVNTTVEFEGTQHEDLKDSDKDLVEKTNLVQDISLPPAIN